MTEAFYNIFMYLYNVNILEYGQIAQNRTESIIPDTEGHSKCNVCISACLGDITTDTCSLPVKNVSTEEVCSTTSSSRTLKAPPILAYTFNSTLKMCTTFEFFGCLTANVFLDRKACVKGKTLNLKARFPKMMFYV